jgi:hypothetical protein
MIELLIDSLVDTLAERSLADGGFSGHKGGRYRPDATAWAVFVLGAAGKRSDLVQAGRERLSADQGTDGRVSVSPETPQSFWPTALSVLAWHGAASFQEEQSRAVKFLLATTGKHWRKRDNSPMGHDPSIRGWPWNEDTHSWVEPTSLVLLALALSGHRDYERCHEARHLLLDRQLPEGGWNYGNTTVFEQVLRPMPESTGMALNALASRNEKSQVDKSIAYLRNRIDALSTPLSLGWSLLGLSAWGERPPQTPSLLQHCYDRQDTMGPYETTQLALLIAALMGEQGLLSCINPTEAVQ